MSHSNILKYEEIETITRVALDLGVKKVRLTGGEPLTRAGIATLVQKLCGIPGLNDLAMTTNGTLFYQLGPSLRDAGLKRVNFGISSLDRGIYAKIARNDCLQSALDGLDLAIKLGFAPIKVNVVAMRGINDDIAGYVALAKEKPLHVRFIEYMPLGPADHSLFFIPASEISQRISTVAELKPMVAPIGNGPAQSAWRIRGGLGSIAIIAPMTEHICKDCNRLRLTADGHLRLCLFSKGEIDLKPALRPTLDEEMLKSLFIDAVQKKPASLHETTGFGRNMSQIGG